MNVSDYARHYGVRALPPVHGRRQYMIEPSCGYEWRGGWEGPHWANSAHEARQLVNIMANVPQHCGTCGRPREGSYGNIRA